MLFLEQKNKLFIQLSLCNSLVPERAGDKLCDNYFTRVLEKVNRISPMLAEDAKVRYLNFP